MAEREAACSVSWLAPPRAAELEGTLLGVRLRIAWLFLSFFVCETGESAVWALLALLGDDAADGALASSMVRHACGLR